MNRSQANDTKATAAAGAQPATGTPATKPRKQYRFSAARKAQAVLRLLGGESLEPLSRQLGVPAHELSQWRERFVACGQAGMKKQQPDLRDEQIRRLKAKIGDLTMDYELLQERLHRTDEPPFGKWRSNA